MTKNKANFYFLSIAGLMLYRTLLAGVMEPLLPLPINSAENMEKVALGKRLFHDNRLSHNGERSCATCHPLDSGAMDGKVRAESADGISVLRNTPSLFNVSFNYFYNWDGVASTLEAHTEKVILNPKIMNATWPVLLSTLSTDSSYQQDFTALYSDGLTQANLIDALTSFERSLITPNARFDRFLRDEKNALDTEEQQGYQLFITLGCVACHQGMNIGGNLFQKFGIFGELKGNSPRADEGRYSVTKNERDQGVYRVPSLRNVAITAPYFHDGRATTLEEAVDTMAQNQLGKPLSIKERGLLIKFLNTLTGEYLGKPVTHATIEPH